MEQINELTEDIIIKILNEIGYHNVEPKNILWHYDDRTQAIILTNHQIINIYKDDCGYYDYKENATTYNIYINEFKYKIKFNINVLADDIQLPSLNMYVKTLNDLINKYDKNNLLNYNNLHSIFKSNLNEDRILMYDGFVNVLIDKIDADKPYYKFSYQDNDSDSLRGYYQVYLMSNGDFQFAKKEKY